MLRAGEFNCLPSHKEGFAVHQEEAIVPILQFFPTKKPLDLLWLLSVLSKLYSQPGFYSTVYSTQPSGLVRTGTYLPRTRVSESTSATGKLGVTLTSAHWAPRGVRGARGPPRTADNGRQALVQPLQTFSWKACFTQITNELKEILKKLSVDWNRHKENPWSLLCGSLG